MTMKSDELESAALKLDPQARARLAAKLLRSLDALSVAESQARWLEEAERRDAELDAGAAEDRPAFDVLWDARANL